jgi:hypothetical protein
VAFVAETAENGAVARQICGSLRSRTEEIEGEGKGRSPPKIEGGVRRDSRRNSKVAKGVIGAAGGQLPR